MTQDLKFLIGNLYEEAEKGKVVFFPGWLEHDMLLIMKMSTELQCLSTCS